MKTLIPGEVKWWEHQIKLCPSCVRDDPTAPAIVRRKAAEACGCDSGTCTRRSAPCGWTVLTKAPPAGNRVRTGVAVGADDPSLIRYAAERRAAEIEARRALQSDAGQALAEAMRAGWPAWVAKALVREVAAQSGVGQKRALKRRALAVATGVATARLKLVR